MGKKSDNISEKDIKTLCLKSGNLCAFPDCNVELAKQGSTGSNMIIGVMAHIKGKNPTSARYDSSMGDKDRDSYENRVLLCPTHHIEIDKDPNLYTVEKLLEIKTNHEAWVKESLRKEEISITFVELEATTQFLVSKEIQIGEAISVIPPKDKINKNQLSASVEEYIKIGMLKSRLVSQYITQHPDVDFGERLKKGFVDKYLEFKNNGMSGDEIFLELFEFASSGSSDFKKQAAALAVLTYFFETCEVFEE
jgi:hypothetical protein